MERYFSGNIYRDCRFRSRRSAYQFARLFGLRAADAWEYAYRAYNGYAGSKITWYGWKCMAELCHNIV